MVVDVATLRVHQDVPAKEQGAGGGGGVRVVSAEASLRARGVARIVGRWIICAEAAFRVVRSRVVPFVAPDLEHVAPELALGYLGEVLDLPRELAVQVRRLRACSRREGCAGSGATSGRRNLETGAGRVFDGGDVFGDVFDGTAAGARRASRGMFRARTGRVIILPGSTDLSDPVQGPSARAPLRVRRGVDGGRKNAVGG